MAAPTDTSTTLDLTSRAAEGSRSARRLRRTGQVPGVIYGGDGNAELFAVDGRILRNTLARSGAILQISVDGAAPGPVLVKDIQRHPVRGEAMHVDFLRVDMNQAIQTTVVLELVGDESAPGVVEGGVLSQGAIELNIEALPGDIPDGIQFDVSDDGDERDGHAVGAHPARGRHAARRPRRDRARHDHPAEPGAGGRGDRDRDGGRGRGRGGRRGRGPGRGRVRGRVLGRVLKLFSSAPVDWLVVGLGNPGPGYANTPHNVGFLVADALIERWDLPKPKKKFAGELSEGRTGPGGPRVAVLKPQTFMNDAGRSVGPARGSFKLDLDRVLVVHDEIDLPFGDIRVRLGGGLAGHNGLKSLKRELGSRGLPPRAHRRRPAGLDRSGARVGARAREVAPERRRGARARRARSRRGRGAHPPYVITYDRMPPRDWDATTYERIAAPLTAMGSDVLDRLVLAGDETVLDAGCGTGNVTRRCSSGCRAAA